MPWHGTPVPLFPNVCDHIQPCSGSGKSNARISQLLGGSSNLTIGTLAEIAFVLGLTLDTTFKDYSEGRYLITEEQGPIKRPVSGVRTQRRKSG
jgi:transcriptional regulator with XRE-family HTH domain